MVDSNERSPASRDTTRQEHVTEFEVASADSLTEPGWVHRKRPDWREDTAYARDNPPALLRSVKAPRLLAMGALRKQAKIAIQSDEPKTPDEAARCLRPAICGYAEEIFDKLAEAKLAGYRSGVRTRTYGQWLRSKCQSVVIEDVCRPIFGQFQTTVQQIAESIPDSGGERGAARRALWGILAKEWDPHSFSRGLEDHLRNDLDDRSLYWEAQSVSRRGVALAAEGPTTAAIRKKPRGRPQTIPDELKAKAAELKKSGGTNRQAAAKIYNTRHPTQQQVRNVSSILRNYVAKVEKQLRPGPKRPKPSTETQ
jgi:hypothetical protein